MIDHIGNFLVFITQFKATKEGLMAAEIDVEEAEDLINIACLDSDDDIHFEPMAIYHDVNYKLTLKEDKAILTIDPTTIQGSIQEDEEVAIILNEEMDLEILGEERIIHVVGETEEPQARILKGVSE